MAAEIITITDPASGSSASIAPALGFNCFSFVAAVAGKQVEVLWHDPQFREGNTRPSRSGIPILFPFAGRIRAAAFHYRGRDYQLEPSDPKGNAIHGFVFTRPWRVVAQTESSVTGEFQASVDDPAILARWPADFCIRATYEVSGTRLLARYEITNPSDVSLPWWLGTHPYFRLSLGGGEPSEAMVRFPITSQWELSDQLVPTGEVVDVAEAGDYARGVQVGDREFDNAFSGLVTSETQWGASVTDTTSGITTTIRFGAPFRECVVFIPPHREAICLEPYSGVPNAFELTARGLDAGLQELAPGDSHVLSVNIEVSSAASM